MAKEPKQLKRGKIYHKKLQKDWKHSSEGIVGLEKHIKKPNNGIGRIDIHVEADNKLVAVVELKNSDWDKMAVEAVKINVKRYSKQVWGYIDSQLDDKKDISPGIIFPEKPNIMKKLELIEKLFEEQFISVVWEDESIKERKKRT